MLSRASLRLPNALARAGAPLARRFSSPSDALPSHARVVVCGGGIIGTSIAYHLAKLGWDDVLLIERDQLTSGTTWHAAGLVGQMRATKIETLISAEAVGVYARLEEETGSREDFSGDN